MAIQRSAFFFVVAVDIQMSARIEKEKEKKKRRKKRAGVPSWEDGSMGCHRLQSPSTRGGRGGRWR